MSRPRIPPVHEAKKRFGQNFLHDGHVIERIIRAIHPQPDDCIVEIGPGQGALTLPLLERLETLTAIELDRDVIPHLLRACAESAHKLKLMEADALQVDYGALAAAAGKPLRLVGNLPYNVATPLLFKLLEHADAVRDMHFMLQKEVVDRMCAEADDDDYGRLTVTLAARAECFKLFKVGPGSFNPPPKVDSAIVRLLPRPAPFALGNLAAFDRVVTAAFSMRRKTLANALKKTLSVEGIRAAGINPQARAETLPPEAFGQLAIQYLAEQAGSAD